MRKGIKLVYSLTEGCLPSHPLSIHALASSCTPHSQHQGPLRATKECAVVEPSRCEHLGAYA
eukprot:6481257-Amphidinium_carterae.1